MQNSKFALFLGDLSMHCNEADLEEAFSPYGTILEIRVKRSKETAKTLSYGFLEFASASSAVNAMNDMDGYVLKGRPLRIRWAASKKNPVRKRDIREDLSDRISMHVKFMSYKIDKVITEELLRNLFSIYGEVCDTTIKQVSIDRKSHRLKGYGFVSYFNDESGYMAAQRALTELHDTSLDDVTFKCELSNIIDEPRAAPYSPHMAMGMVSPHHQLQGMGLSSGAAQEFDFDISQHQSSYYDDYDGQTSAETTLYQPSTASFETGFPEASPAPPLRGLSTSLSSNSGFEPSSAPPARGLAHSLSSNSDTFNISLDKDPGASPTMASLELRAPANLQTEDITSPYAITPLLSSSAPPARGIPHQQGSYKITPPTGGDSMTSLPPRQASAPRSFQYGQQPQGQNQSQGMSAPQYGAQFPTQYPAQYASQSRYHGNRDGNYPQQQQQYAHAGVAAHGGYDAPPQYNPRRAVGNMNNNMNAMSGHQGSSLSAQAPYWQPQQGGAYGPSQHHNPRPQYNNQYQQQQRYEPRPQYPNHQQMQYGHQQAPQPHPLQGNYAPNPRLHQPIYARAPPPAPSLSLGLPGDYNSSPLPLGQQSAHSHSGSPASFERSPNLAAGAPRPFFNDISLDATLGQGLGLSTVEPLSLSHGLGATFLGDDNKASATAATSWYDASLPQM